jgi:hypothetical protein
MVNEIIRICSICLGYYIGHAKIKRQRREFEPLRAEPSGFLVHHLNRSVTLSLVSIHKR